MEPFADQLNIDTPELVSIEMPLAGIGSRFIAIALDYLIWSAAIVLLSIVSVFALPKITIFGHVSEHWATGILLLILFLLHWGYFALFEALGNGRTPGKRVARIRVIHRSGRAISFVESLARNLVRVVDYLPSLYAVGIITIFLSRQNQRLGDMAAGTLVVRDSRIDTPYWGEMSTRTITAPAYAAAAPRDSLLSPPHLRVILPVSAVARLSGADLAVLEGFFARRLDMDMATRQTLAERMASAVCAKSGLSIPEGTSVETFLEAVAHQLRELGPVR